MTVPSNGQPSHRHRRGEALEVTYVKGQPVRPYRCDHDGCEVVLT